MLSFFPRDVLDEIWDLIESVSEGFPTYSGASSVSYVIHMSRESCKSSKQTSAKVRVCLYDSEFSREIF